MPSKPDEVLDSIYKRGDAIKRTRRAKRAGTLAALALVAGVAATIGGDDTTAVVASGSETTASTTSTTSAPDATTTLVPTTTSAGSPSTSQTESTLTTTTRAVSPSTTGTTVPRTTTVPSTTTPESACRNSYDEACGGFYYDPQPTNQPITITSSGPDNVEAGAETTFTFTVADPDSPIARECIAIAIDDQASAACPMPGCARPQRFPHGPWDPPPPEAGSATRSRTHTFAQPGTYTVSVSYFSNAYVCEQPQWPYGSNGSRDFTVTVRPASAGSAPGTAPTMGRHGF